MKDPAQHCSLLRTWIEGCARAMAKREVSDVKFELTQTATCAQTLVGALYQPHITCVFATNGLAVSAWFPITRLQLQIFEQICDPVVQVPQLHVVNPLAKHSAKHVRRRACASLQQRDSAVVSRAQHCHAACASCSLFALRICAACATSRNASFCSASRLLTRACMCTTFWGTR